MIPKKESSIGGGSETKDKEINKKSIGAKGKGNENVTTTTMAGDVSAQQSLQAPSLQSQQQQPQVEKAKDLKADVPVVSAAGPALNEDAHHINNVIILNLINY